MSYKYSKYFMWISVLIALIFTVTCKLQPFSSVRVKANPKVYFPLGAKSITEDEVFKKFENLVPKNARLYRYQSGQDDKLHYLMHYPLKTLELDISKYFNGDPLGNSGSGNNAAFSHNFSKTISVPDLRQSKDISIDVSRINQELLTKFNTGNTTPKVTISSGTLPSSSYPLPAVNVKFQGFKTIAFKDGAKLKLSLNSSTAHYAITAAEMKSNGRSRDAETISGQNIEFSLDGITINDTVSFQLTLNLTSGSGDIFLGTSLEGVIEKATGVTSDTDIDINLPAQFVPLTLPADFEKATIAEGSMKLSTQMPDGWENIVIKEKMEVKQSGSDGFLISPSDYRPLGSNISLENQKLNKQRLSYTPVFKVKLNNATYTKHDRLPVTLALDIKKFKEITLKNPSDLTDEKNEPIPNTIKDWVKKIKFNSVSATIKLNNGLPEGNPVTITLESTAFKIPSHSEEFAAEQETTKVYHGTPNWELDVEHTTSPLDLKSTVRLPGYDSDKDTFTVKNISTGSNITFSGAVSFNLDWEEITLKAKTNQTGSFPETSSQDLSALTSKLKIAGIKLKEIPMYFYAGSDLELPNSTAVTVQLTAKYHKPDNSPETKTLVNKNNIVTLKALPAGTFPSDNKKPFTGSMPDPTLEIKEGEAGSQTTWTKIMNEYPKDLQLSYNLSMNEITINGTKYKEYKEKYKNKNPKVSIDLVLDVPVGFKVDSETMPSLTELSGINMPDNDLFGRGSSNDKPFGVKQLSDGLRFKVGITLKNGLNGASVVPKFVLQFKDGDGNSIKNAVGNPIEKTVTVAGEQALTFTATELDELLKKYPVKPELYLKLPSGDYSLRRDFELGASLSALVEADIDYTTKVK
jgi:putative lipoprotein